MSDEQRRRPRRDQPITAPLAADEVTARLDHVYAQIPSTLDAALRKAQKRAIGPEFWIKEGR
jgi:hypothetical protein